MMKENVIRTKSFNFSVKVVNLYKSIFLDKKEFILSGQLLRSGTSIGAMVRESEQAESRADFIHKLAIALKEAHESDYWLDLLNETNYISDLEFNKMKQTLVKF